jgi:hypothetical protein
VDAVVPVVIETVVLPPWLGQARLEAASRNKSLPVSGCCPKWQETMNAATTSGQYWADALSQLISLPSVAKITFAKHGPSKSESVIVDVAAQGSPWVVLAPVLTIIVLVVVCVAVVVVVSVVDTTVASPRLGVQTPHNIGQIGTMTAAKVPLHIATLTGAQRSLSGSQVGCAVERSPLPSRIDSSRTTDKADRNGIKILYALVSVRFTK